MVSFLKIWFSSTVHLYLLQYSNQMGGWGWGFFYGLTTPIQHFVDPSTFLLLPPSCQKRHCPVRLPTPSPLPHLPPTSQHPTLISIPTFAVGSSNLRCIHYWGRRRPTWDTYCCFIEATESTKMCPSKYWFIFNLTSGYLKAVEYDKCVKPYRTYGKKFRFFFSFSIR